MATYNPIPRLTGDSGGGGGGPSATPVVIEVLNGGADSVVLPNGQTTTPLTFVGSTPLDFDVLAPFAGTLVLKISYTMSAANGGSVDLGVSNVIVQDGDDPDPVFPAPATVSFTPGADTLEHRQQVLSVSVVADDRVKVELDNLGTGTHTGDVLIVSIYGTIA